MKKFLPLVVALAFVGCAEEPAPEETTVVEEDIIAVPAEPMMDTTMADPMMGDPMMADTTGMMEGEMMADTTTTM